MLYKRFWRVPAKKPLLTISLFGCWLAIILEKCQNREYDRPQTLKYLLLTHYSSDYSKEYYNTPERLQIDIGERKNMADAAAARREARRRRILDNSQNRLQLISGKSSDECIKESTNKFPIPEQICEVSVASDSLNSCLSSFNNGLLVTESQSFGLLSADSDFVATGDGEVSNDLAAFASSPAEPAQSKSFWEKVLIHKYDIVLLSLLYQLLYSFFLFTFDNVYFFLPLIMYTITKLMWTPTQSKSNIANAFLLLNGMSASKVNNIMSIMHWLGMISQDICIFLFSTICLQALYISLTDTSISSSPVT